MDRAHLLKLKEKLYAICQEAIRDRAFPGLAIDASWKGRTALSIAAGRVAWPPWAPEVSNDTIYDLASLTKPLATAMLYMSLVSEGLTSLDTEIGPFFKKMPEDKCAVNIRDLLSHTSGLPAHRPYFKQLMGASPSEARQKMEEWIINEPLCFKPGSNWLYSDPGYILLALIAERICGKPFRELVWEYLFRPLGISGIFWGGERALRAFDVAPSEFCPYRKRVIMAETHDMNAWVLGGAAGHAGLFSKAGTVTQLVTALMAVRHGRERHPYIKQGVVEDFLKMDIEAGKVYRPCGFDVPAPVNSAAGRHFSAGSTGHLGFTGTSFWHDQGREITITLLTNRTFPRATMESRKKIKKWRPIIYDAVMEGIINHNTDFIFPFLC